jgi:N-acetylmuramoyl-L-alanine amidase
MKKIFISIGHGNNGGRFDPGAVSQDGKTTERSVVVSIGQNLRNIIKDNMVVFVNLDTPISHEARVIEVNNICKKEGFTYKDSLFIELHADWNQASEGVSAYYYRGYEEGKVIAETIAKNLALSTSRKFKWVKGDDQARGGSLYVIQKTIPTALILEVGSLRADSNPNDGLELLSRDSGQNDIAMAIANTLHEEYGVKILDQSMPSEARKKTEEAIRIISEAWGLWENERARGVWHESNNLLRTLLPQK